MDHKGKHLKWCFNLLLWIRLLSSNNPVSIHGSRIASLPSLYSVRCAIMCTLKYAVIVCHRRITSGSYDPEVVSSELKLEDPELNVSQYKLAY